MRDLKEAARRVLNRRALMGVHPDEWWELDVYTDEEVAAVRDARSRTPDVVALVKLGATTRERAERMGARGGLLELWMEVLDELSAMQAERNAVIARQEPTGSLVESLARPEVVS